MKKPSLHKLPTLGYMRKRGTVYVLEIKFDDYTLVKIGMTTRQRIEERISEILTEIWKYYRYFPRCYVKRYRKVDTPYLMEQELHDHFKDRRFQFPIEFSGSTEFFKVDVNEVAEVYDKIYTEYKANRESANRERIEINRDSIGNAEMGINTNRTEYVDKEKDAFEKRNHSEE